MEPKIDWQEVDEGSRLEAVVQTSRNKGDLQELRARYPANAATSRVIESYEP